MLHPSIEFPGSATVADERLAVLAKQPACALNDVQPAAPVLSGDEGDASPICAAYWAY